MRLSVVLALPLLLAACGGPAQADIPKVERIVKTGIERQTTAQNVAVECPSEVDWKVGGDFHCVVKDAHGRMLTMVTVSMENDSGDITWQAG